MFGANAFGWRYFGQAWKQETVVLPNLHGEVVHVQPPDCVIHVDAADRTVRVAASNRTVLVEERPTP